MAKTQRSRSSATKTPNRTARARATGKRAAPKLPKAVATAVRAARDKKAQDVIVLDLRNAGGFTDYFVICTGNNTRQINAIADSVRDILKTELDERPALTEEWGAKRLAMRELREGVLVVDPVVVHCYASFGRM